MILNAECFNAWNILFYFIIQVRKAISEKPAIKENLARLYDDTKAATVLPSRDRPPFAPPGSAPNPYIAPGKLPTTSRPSSSELKSSLPMTSDINSIDHDWDDEDDRRDPHCLNRTERRLQGGSSFKNDSDREPSQPRTAGVVPADSDWLADNFDED